MAGYNDTKELIIRALMGRPEGEEIQPENHQAYALNMLDYIRSLELVSTSTLIGIAESNTVPVQPNDSRVCYIAGVGQDRTVTFSNFIDDEGNPISITTGEMEGVFVILLWNMEHWVAYTFNTNIISSAESANFYYNYNIRKTYASVAAMNADSVNPIGTDGRLIKIGELVTVVNSTTPAENGYYSYEGSENGWLLQSGFSFEIVQTTGTDINKVMSQKAVTDEITQLAVNTLIKATEADREYGRFFLNLRKTGQYPSFYKFTAADASPSMTTEELITDAMCLIPSSYMTVNGADRVCAITALGWDASISKYFVEYIVKRTASNYSDLTGWKFRVEKDNPFTLNGEKVSATDNGVTIEAELFGSFKWDKINTKYTTTTMDSAKITVSAGYGPLNALSTQQLNQDIQGKEDKILRSSKTVIRTDTNTALRSAICIDEAGDVWVVSYDSNIFRIFKNNAQQAYKVDYTKPYFTGLSCYAKSGIIHILVASARPASSANGLYYIKYDTTDKTFTDGARLETSENARLLSKNIIEFEGTLYTAVSTTAVISGGAFDSDKSHRKIHLFKLNGDVWEQVSLISKYGDILGSRFINDAGLEEMTVADKGVAPSIGSLYIKDNNLHCLWYSGSSSYSRYMLVDMVTTDLLSWEYHKLHRYAVGLSALMIESGGVNFLIQLSTPITNPSAVGATMTLKISIEDDYNCYDTKIVGATSYSAVTNNDGIYLSTTKTVSSTSTLETTFILWSDLMKVVKPVASNFRGSLYPDSPLPTNLKAGDYWEALGNGTYSNLYEKLDQYHTTFTVQKIKVFAGEAVNIIYNGYNFSKQVISDRMLSARSSYPFIGYIHRNPFMSHAFRIPVIVQSKSKTLLAFADVRRTTGKDYDEIDVGLRRSFDGGKTWRDAIIVFERVQEPGFRVHDPGAVVDKNTGRIWAFAKHWLANVDPFNSTFWSANPNLRTFVAKYSDDNGSTWSEEIDLSHLKLEGSSIPQSGASAGIQLFDGTLIQPIYIGGTGGERGGNLAGFIYLLPGETNWQLGDFVPDYGVNENQIVQMPNGNLLMSARNTGFGVEKRRFYELETIGGGWIYRDDMENLEQQTGGVAESFVRYRNTYIHSGPTNYGSTSRQNVTVFYSYDAINWEKLITVSNPLNTAGGGYSSLVVSDDYFGILHEMPKWPSGIEFTDLSFYRNILR